MPLHMGKEKEKKKKKKKKKNRKRRDYATYSVALYMGDKCVKH